MGSDESAQGKVSKEQDRTSFPTSGAADYKRRFAKDKDVQVMPARSDTSKISRASSKDEDKIMSRFSGDSSELVERDRNFSLRSGMNTYGKAVKDENRGTLSERKQR